MERQGPEDADLVVSSSTLSGGSGRNRSLSLVTQPATRFSAAGPSALFVHTLSHSPSFSSTTTSVSLSSNDRHHTIGDALNPWQTSSMPPAPLSSLGSSSSTAEPTTSTAAKKKKWEKKILRCGQCRQPYPPKDPEGLVHWFCGFNVTTATKCFTPFV